MDLWISVVFSMKANFGSIISTSITAWLPKSVTWADGSRHVVVVKAPASKSGLANSYSIKATLKERVRSWILQPDIHSLHHKSNGQEGLGYARL